MVAKQKFARVAYRSPDGWLQRLLGWTLALGVTVLILIGLFRSMVFSNWFHVFEHRRLGTVQQAPQVAPLSIIGHLQAYFRSDGLGLMEYPLFSYRERMHYREVKRLLQITQTVWGWTTLASMSLALGLVCIARGTPQSLLRLTAFTLQRCAILLVGVVLLFSLLALRFDSHFVYFHFIVFKTRYWLLPPYATTVQLFPTRYFLDFLLTYTALVASVAMLSWALAHRTRRGV